MSMQKQTDVIQLKTKTNLQKTLLIFLILLSSYSQAILHFKRLQVATPGGH